MLNSVDVSLFEHTQNGLFHTDNKFPKLIMIDN